jgi:hypothetical protein
MNVLELLKSVSGHLAPRFDRISPAIADAVQPPTCVAPVGNRSRPIPDSGENSIEQERVQAVHERIPVSTFFAPSDNAARDADLRFDISLRAAACCSCAAAKVARIAGD